MIESYGPRSRPKKQYSRELPEVLVSLSIESKGRLDDGGEDIFRRFAAAITRRVTLVGHLDRKFTRKTVYHTCCQI
jgi:hypothetical protein